MEKGQLIKVIIIAICLIGAVVLIAMQLMPASGGGPSTTNDDGQSVPLRAPTP